MGVKRIQGEAPQKTGQGAQAPPGSSAGKGERLVPGGGRRLWLLALFLLAITLRLVHLLQIRENPFFGDPPLDAGVYDAWARRIAGGDFLGTDVYYQAPLYPYFLALVYRVFGHGFLIARVLQAFIDSLGCILIWGIGRKVGGDRVGWIAGLLAALYAPFIFYQGMLLKATLSLFLIEAALLLLLLAAEGRDWRGWLQWAAAGLVLGLSTICRANFLILLPFMIGWSWWASRGIRRRTLLARLGLLCLTSSIPILSVGVRNLFVAKDFVLISANGGQTFYLGNNEHNRNGAYQELPNVRSHPVYEKADFGILALQEMEVTAAKPSQFSRHYFRKGLRFGLEKPGEFVLLLGKKLLLLVNRLEVPDNQNIYFFKRFAPLLRLPLPGFGILAPLGLAGLLVFWRRGPGFTLLAIYLWVYAASVVAFYVLARYRLPLAPALMVFAGAALERVYLDCRARGVRGGWKWAAWLVGFGILVHLPLPFVGRQMSQAHAMLGQLYMDRGEGDLGILEFQEAVKIQPDSPGALSSLGQLRMERGDLDGALGAYRELARLRPERGEPLYNLAVVLQAQGRQKEALDMYFESFEVERGYLPAYRNTALLLEETGKGEEALRLLREILKLFPDYGEGWFTLGRILEGLGRYREAIAGYEMTAEAEPGHRHGPIHFRMAACYARLGEREEVIKQLQSMDLAGYKPGPGELQEVIDSLSE